MLDRWYAINVDRVSAETNEVVSTNRTLFHAEVQVEGSIFGRALLGDRLCDWAIADETPRFDLTDEEKVLAAKAEKELF